MKTATIVGLTLSNGVWEEDHLTASIKMADGENRFLGKVLKFWLKEQASIFY